MNGRYLLDTNILIALFAIAAIALQNDLTLATRDTHFNEIEGLKTALW